MQIEKSAPIGLFDSGVGGLTVANAIRSVLPNERMVYFGDTFHLPYGDKSVDSIRYYSRKITDFLLQQGCKVVVIACNTASANAYQEVLDFVKQRAVVINVIDPVVSHIVAHHDNKKGAVGVIGTKGTIQSNSYRERVHAKDARVNVKSLATPLLVPMIEEGFVNDEISDAILGAYLEREALHNIATLILGCTHYPLVREQVARYYEGRVNVLDSASIVAESLKVWLTKHDLLCTKEFAQEFGEHRFFVSDYTDNFKHIAESFFQQKIDLRLLNLWR